MLNVKYLMLIILFTFLAFSCNKKSPTESKEDENIDPPQQSETVNISQITCDKTTVTVIDTVKLECIATFSGTLHYHWSLEKGNTVYESNIIDREDTSSSFDFGKWIKWSPPSSGTWTIEVLAYLSSADHYSYGTGSWKIYNEWDFYGNLERQHCFNYAEKGDLWNIKSITKSVDNVNMEVTPDSVALNNGQTQQFTCTTTFSDQSTKDVTSSAIWSVSPGVAGSIDASGLFTAHASNDGQETITAIYGGQIAKASVIVLTTVTVTPDFVTLNNGQTQKFTCTLTLSDQSRQDVTSFAAWSVSPGTAGSIDVSGLFAAHASNTGQETITATYGGQIANASVIVLTTGTVTDIDGNVYKTVKIVNQWWMVENLKVTHYRNGEAIPNVTDDIEWRNLTTGAYCNYDNNADNVATYGSLYNWYAVNDSRSIAPEGWHVPSDDEWQTLVDYLGGDAVAGGRMKETGTTHWSFPNTGATNEGGFSALPGGFRSSNGPYLYMGDYADFWSSTEHSSIYAGYRYLSFYLSVVSRASKDKGFGYSVRCVRD